MIEVPFLYTTCYAFKLLLMYDNKRYIKLNDLYAYRKTVLDNILEDYYDNEDSQIVEQNIWNGDIEFEEINEEDELSYLLTTYPNTFYLNDEQLCLKKHINLELLEIILKSFNMPHSIFFEANFSKEILELLGIRKIYQIKEKIEQVGLNIEKELEKEYFTTQNPDKIKNLLLKRAIFLVTVFGNNNLYIQNYLSLPPGDDDLYLEENDFYDSFSKYKTNDDELPIDSDLYKNSDFYEELSDYISVLEDNLEDLYQYAIFGNGELYKDKYDACFSEMFYDSKYTFSNKKEEKLTGEFAFYIIYLQKLNEWINKGKKELTTVKNRLLYTLDEHRYSLYLPKNFEAFYQKACLLHETEDSLKEIAGEAKYFIIEAFEGKQVKIMEKLLFSATYYQLTDDQEIIKLLNNYKKDKNYEKFYQIIIAEQKGYTKKIK